MLEIVNLALREGEILCSYAFLGICEAIFRGRDLIFCGEPHISINFTDTKFFFFYLTTWSLLQDVQLTSFYCFYFQFWFWTSWSRLQVVKIKKWFYIREIYSDMRFPTKNRSLPLKMALHIMISLRMHNWKKSPPLLEQNWRFQAPKVRGFFRHKFLFFMKCFQIFINVNLQFFQKKKIEAWEINFSAQKIHLLCNISQWTPCIYIWFIALKKKNIYNEISSKSKF